MIMMVFLLLFAGFWFRPDQNQWWITGGFLKAVCFLYDFRFLIFLFATFLMIEIIHYCLLIWLILDYWSMRDFPDGRYRPDLWMTAFKDIIIMGIFLNVNFMLMKRNFKICFHYVNSGIISTGCLKMYLGHSYSNINYVCLQNDKF